jgi:hypothetical protein
MTISALARPPAGGCTSARDNRSNNFYLINDLNFSMESKERWPGRPPVGGSALTFLVLFVSKTKRTKKESLMQPGLQMKLINKMCW